MHELFMGESEGAVRTTRELREIWTKQYLSTDALVAGELNDFGTFFVLV